MDVIEIGKSYYYNGVGIVDWKNKLVKVLSNTGEMVGTNRDVPVYLCECEEDGSIHRVVGPNLSGHQVSYETKEDRQLLPPGVKTFPTYKNGKYMYEYTWGKY